MGLEVIAPADDWPDVVRHYVLSKEEAWRKECVRRKVKLFKGQYQEILRDHLYQVFREPAVRLALEPFLPFVGGPSLTKRVANELARPLYARAPQRRVMMPGREMGGDSKLSPEQVSYSALVSEMSLNGCLDAIARYLTPSPDMFAGVRYLERTKSMVCDVMTADMVSVIPDKDVPTRALAICYETAWDYTGKATKIICWDDTRWLVFDEKSRLLEVNHHNFGLIPIVEIHRNHRIGTYWDTSSGNDLESSDLVARLLELMHLRKIKTQSHIQLAYAGDPSGFIKDQVSDEESVLVVGPGGQIFPINLESNPEAILRVQEMVETRAAANYGISRNRLNQSDEGTDEGLKERVAELASVMMGAELGLFKVTKSVSREHPEHKIPEDATLVVDLGQLHNRVDRATQLETFREEVRQGRKSFLDGVLEDNPEYGGDRELAMKHIREKSAENGAVIELLREANASLDATAEEPGQDSQANGAMGPAVRDGKMSKDDAAAAAKSGKKDLRKIARRVLRGGKDAA